MSSTQLNKNGKAEESSALRSQLEFFLGGVIPVDAQDDNCTVCLETLDSDVIKVLRCSHCFHITCIIPWFTSDGARRGSCPACRRELYKPAPLIRAHAEPIFPSLQHAPDRPRSTRPPATPASQSLESQHDRTNPFRRAADNPRVSSVFDRLFPMGINGVQERRNGVQARLDDYARRKAEREREDALCREADRERGLAFSRELQRRREAEQEGEVALSFETNRDRALALRRELQQRREAGHERERVRQIQSIQSREAERLRGLSNFSSEATRHRHVAEQLLHLTRQPYPHGVNDHANSSQSQPAQQESTSLHNEHAQAAPPVHEEEELIDYSDEEEEPAHQPAPIQEEEEEEEALYDYGGPYPEEDGEPAHQSAPVQEEEDETIDWFDEEPTQPPAPAPEEEEVLYNYGGWSDEEEPTQLQSESPPPPDPYSEMPRTLRQRVEAEDCEREYAEHSIDLNNHPFYSAHRSGQNNDTSHRTAIECSYDEIEEPGHPFIDNSRAARDDQTNPQRGSAPSRAPATSEKSDDDIVKAFTRRLSAAARRLAMQGFRRNEDIDMEEIGGADDA
jgi:hypothetical protein